MCVAPFLAQQVEELLDEARHARQRDALVPEDRRSRREMGAEQLVGRVDEVELHRVRLGLGRQGTRLDELLEADEVGLEDRAQGGRHGERAEVGEERRDQALVPADDRGASRRRPASRVIRPRPVNEPSWLIPKRCGGSNSVIVTGSVDRDAEDPDVGLALRADADRTRRQQADRLHLVHPARLPSMSATSAQTRSIGASMTIIELIGVGSAPSACLARMRSTAKPMPAPTSASRSAPRITAPHHRPPHPDARGLHLLERPLAVAWLELHGRDGVGQDVRLEPEPRGVERGRLDAVVGREADDDHVVDAGVAQQGFELGRDRLAAGRVAHREAGIAVLAVGALADPRRVLGECQARMELRAPRARDAMDRPDAAVLREMRGRLRVPVLGRDDDRRRCSAPSRSRG